MRSEITVSAVLGGLGGMALLGLCAASGSVDVDAIVPGTFVTVAPLLGAVLLTTPALMAIHQFLGLSAKPEATVAALAHALVVGGRVAAGLAPACLFFAATTRLWVVLLAVALAIPGLVTAVVAVIALRRAEGAPTDRFAVLLAAWTVLTTLIALRIAYDIVDLTLHGAFE
jgi:hypothetical protein